MTDATAVRTERREISAFSFARVRRKAAGEKPRGGRRREKNRAEKGCGTEKARVQRSIGCQRARVCDNMIYEISVYRS